MFAPSSFIADFDSADGQNNGYNEEKYAPDQSGNNSPLFQIVW